MSATPLPYYANCVNWNPADVKADGGLCDMIDARREITRRTFKRHVNALDLAHLEQSLGYAPHCKDSRLHMVKDWHVSYYRSRLHAHVVYFFKHSGIEYVFASL